MCDIRRVVVNTVWGASTRACVCAVNIVYCVCVWVCANDGRPEAVRRPAETRAAAYNILVGYYYYYYY